MRKLVTAGIFAALLSACVPLAATGVVGGAALVGTDRRSSGAYVDDQTFAVRLSSQIKREFPDAHINVTSFNRGILLTGEVIDADVQAAVGLLARALPNVRRVYNKTVIAENSTLGNRLNDATLTAKVKARMLEARLFSPTHVLVVSERAEVFLMGLVTPEEGAAAAKIASETAGVYQVHTLFEYIDTRHNTSP